MLQETNLFFLGLTDKLLQILLLFSYPSTTIANRPYNFYGARRLCITIIATMVQKEHYIRSMQLFAYSFSLIYRPVSSLQPCVCWAFCHRWSSNRAAITKPDRKIYVRMYQSRFVLPDGSTIQVRYHEPRKCIKVKRTLRFVSF